MGGTAVPASAIDSAECWSVLLEFTFPPWPEPEAGFPTCPETESELDAPCPVADTGPTVASMRSADEVRTIKESPLRALLAVGAEWRRCAIICIYKSRVTLKQLYVGVDYPSQAP